MSVAAAPLRATWLGRAAVVLVAVAVLLAAASLVLPRLPALPALRDVDQPWVTLLDVRDEGSVHTWYNVLLLGAAALLAGLNALVRTAAGAPAWGWWVVAGVLAALSLDDMLSLHEQLELVGERLGGGEGALHFAWVVPGAVLGLGLVVLVLLAGRQLPAGSRTTVMAATALLLVAALGLEAVGGLVITLAGDGPGYIVVSHVEELVESVAAVAFVVGVLRGLRWRAAPGGVLLQPAGPPRTTRPGPAPGLGTGGADVHERRAATARLPRQQPSTPAVP